MTSDLGQIQRDMENGTYNFTQNGKCCGCGSCCSNLLPVTRKEIEVIKRFVKKKHVKAQNHTALCVGETIDMTCPFLNTSKSKDRCEIYQVRPLICRNFICDPAQRSKHVTKKEFIPIDVRETFFGDSK